MNEDWQSQYRDLDFVTLDEAAIILAGFDPTEPIDSIQMPIVERWWRLLRDAVVTQQVGVLDQQNENGEFFAVSHDHIRRWCEARGHPWPLAASSHVQAIVTPALESQSLTPEPTQPEPPKKRGRDDNLKLAILDAWRKGFPVDSPGAALFEHLVTRDDTGYIRGRDGNDMKWENSSGEITTTSKKAVINRLPRYREHFLKHG